MMLQLNEEPFGMNDIKTTIVSLADIMNAKEEETKVDPK